MALTEGQLIQSLRQRVFELAEDDEARQIDQVDLETIASGNDLLWRFALYELESNPQVVDKNDLNSVNIERAAQLLLRTLKWRKEFGIHEIKDSDIPREFYLLKMFTYSMYPEAKRIFLYIRVAKYKNISSSIRSLIIKGIIHEIEKKIRLFEKQYKHGVCELNPIIILDCSGIKYQSIDITLLTEMVNIVSNHFPQAVDEFWVYGLPWFARYLLPVFLKAIPSLFAKRIRQVYFEEAVAAVGMEMLPGFMGGTSKVDPVLDVPSTATTLEELSRKHILEKEDAKKFLEHYKSVSSGR